MNTFAYLENNPVNSIDPYGLWSADASNYTPKGGGGVTVYGEGDSGPITGISISYGSGLGGGVNIDSKVTIPDPCSKGHASWDIFGTVQVGYGFVSYGGTFYAGVTEQVGNSNDSSVPFSLHHSDGIEKSHTVQNPVFSKPTGQIAGGVRLTLHF